MDPKYLMLLHHRTLLGKPLRYLTDNLVIAKIDIRVRGSLPELPLCQRQLIVVSECLLDRICEL